MPKERLILIDGHSLCYRAFYAIRELANSKGQATNAVYGFVATLRKMIREYDPQYLAVCFDSKGKTHRQTKYAEYKIQRPAMPGDLISQIPIIKKVLKAFNVASYEREGYEADDIIATIIKKAKRKKDMEVVIVSDDKDLFQLVNGNIKCYNSRQEALLGQKEVMEKFGVEPRQITDFIGLAGDSSDNIPGVAGIGKVTAQKLLKQYGSLTNILDHLDDVEPAKLQAKLKGNKEDAVMSRELAVLEPDVPIEYNLKDLRVGDPDQARLFELFKELEFRRLAKEYSGEQDCDREITVKEYKTDAQIDSLRKAIKKQKVFAFLADLDESEPKSAVRGIRICVSSGTAGYVPAQGLESLKTIFEDKDIITITHDLKASLKCLPFSGRTFRNNTFDVMLAGFLLNPTRASQKIDDLSWAYLNESIPEVDKKFHETRVIYDVYPKMLEKLKETSLLKLLQEIEIPLSYVLSQMEDHGVKVDLKLLSEMSRECERKIKGLEGRIHKAAGEAFNLNSPKQLSQILFVKLKLPAIKKTKTGFSTNEEVLTRLAAEHEVPSLILEYRQLAKLKSTYIDALPKLVRKDTGRIHAVFDQIGTETGRLSSRQPNLQNIPVRTELGRRIRKAIVPSEPSLVMLAADYSQIELRILAHLSKDKNLLKAFEEDQDIHAYTSSLMFDVKLKDVTKDMRYAAKRVNFGIIYGMSAFGLAKDLKISNNEAQEFIDKYFLRYPNVKTFMDAQIKNCEEKGYVVTLLNRRRYIPEISSTNPSVRQFAQRQAINTPVQGSAADLMKLAMVNIQNEIERKKLNSKMLITVHDELVFDMVKKERAPMLKLVRDLMENPLKLSVPIKVSIKEGPNWLDMKEVD